MLSIDWNVWVLSVTKYDRRISASAFGSKDRLQDCCTYASVPAAVIMPSLAPLLARNRSRLQQAHRNSGENPLHDITTMLHVHKTAAVHFMFRQFSAEYGSRLALLLGLAVFPFCSPEEYDFTCLCLGPCGLLQRCANHIGTKSGVFEVAHACNTPVGTG